MQILSVETIGFQSSSLLLCNTVYTHVYTEWPKKLSPSELSIKRIKTCQRSYRSFLSLNLTAKQAL